MSKENIKMLLEQLMDKLEDNKSALEEIESYLISKLANKNDINSNSALIRVQLNKIMFEYPNDIDKIDINNNLKNVLGDCTVKIKEMKDNNQFYTMLKKKRNLTSTKNFVMNERQPITKPFVNSEFLNQFFMSEHKDCDDNSLYLSFKCYLEDFSNETEIKFRSQLQIYLQTIKIQFFSEYLLSSVFNYLLVKFGRELHWNNMLIISFDSKMEAQENGVITNLSCDPVFILMILQIF